MGNGKNAVRIIPYCDCLLGVLFATGVGQRGRDRGERERDGEYETGKLKREGSEQIFVSLS